VRDKRIGRRDRTDQPAGDRGSPRVHFAEGSGDCELNTLVCGPVKGEQSPDDARVHSGVSVSVLLYW
jgi:hypothetical protein